MKSSEKHNSGADRRDYIIFHTVVTPFTRLYHVLLYLPIIFYKKIQVIGY